MKMTFHIGKTYSSTLKYNSLPFFIFTVKLNHFSPTLFDVWQWYMAVSFNSTGSIINEFLAILILKI